MNVLGYESNARQKPNFGCEGLLKIESEQDKKSCPSLLGSTTATRHRVLLNSWFRTKQEVITRQERTAHEQFHVSVEILTLDLLHYWRSPGASRQWGWIVDEHLWSGPNSWVQWYLLWGCCCWWWWPPLALKSVVTILFGGCLMMRKLLIVCFTTELNTATTSRARTRYKISTLLHGRTYQDVVCKTVLIAIKVLDVSSTLPLRTYSCFSVLYVWVKAKISDVVCCSGCSCAFNKLSAEVGRHTSVSHQADMHKKSSREVSSVGWVWFPGEQPDKVVDVGQSTQFLTFWENPKYICDFSPSCVREAARTSENPPGKTAACSSNNGDDCRQSKALNFF